MNRYTLHNDDNLNVLRRRYFELPNSGKTSPDRVFAEMMLPHNPNVGTVVLGKECFPLLIMKVTDLAWGGHIPRPSSTVPKCPVAFNENVSTRNEYVKDVSECSIRIAKGDACQNIEPKSVEHIIDAPFKRTNSFAVLNVTNGLIARLYARGFWIRPVSQASCLPRAKHQCSSINICNHNIWLRNNTLSLFVGATATAKVFPVPNAFRLRVRTPYRFATCVAGSFVSSGQFHRTKGVRTLLAASGLPPKLETVHLGKILGLTYGTTTLNFGSHAE